MVYADLNHDETFRFNPDGQVFVRCPRGYRYVNTGNGEVMYQYDLFCRVFSAAEAPPAVRSKNVEVTFDVGKCAPVW